MAILMLYKHTFGDTVGPVPDHHNKANITIKPVTRILWFPNAYKS